MWDTQGRVIDIYKEHKGAVVRVFGMHTNQESERELRIGTGFFISREGHVLTPADIGYRASQIWVEYNERAIEAEGLGHDPLSGLAVWRLKSLPKSFNFLHLNESAELPEVGTTLITISCKEGLDPGPSLGMVSGHHGDLPPDLIFPITYLRSSLPCDGGEMGAPVFDLNGRVVGIMMNQLADMNSSLIFPSKAALRVKDDLIFSGRVAYGYFGIEVDVDASLEEEHLVIAKSIPESPASYAGLRQGDQLIQFNNMKIDKIGDLRSAAFFARPGQFLPMTILRDGKELELSIRAKDGPPTSFEPETQIEAGQTLSSN